MFQRRFNSCFKTVKFNIRDDELEALNETERIRTTSWKNNQYVRYMKGEESAPNNDFIFEAIAYNSSFNARDYYQYPLQYSFYGEDGDPRLSLSLCSKIVSSMKEEFKERVYDILGDYYIPNDEKESWSELELAIGYFIAFPIVYLDGDFNSDNIWEICHSFSNRILVINSKDINRLNIYKLLYPTANDNKRLLSTTIVCSTDRS